MVSCQIIFVEERCVENIIILHADYEVNIRQNKLCMLLMISQIHVFNYNKL